MFVCFPRLLPETRRNKTHDMNIKPKHDTYFHFIRFLQSNNSGNLSALNIFVIVQTIVMVNICRRLLDFMRVLIDNFECEKECFPFRRNGNYI